MFGLRYPARGVSALLVERLPTGPTCLQIVGLSVYLDTYYTIYSCDHVVGTCCYIERHITSYIIHAPQYMFLTPLGSMVKIAVNSPPALFVVSLQQRGRWLADMMGWSPRGYIAEKKRHCQPRNTVPEDWWRKRWILKRSCRSHGKIMLSKVT